MGQPGQLGGQAPLRQDLPDVGQIAAGTDHPPPKAVFLAELEAQLDEIGVGLVVDGIGRGIALDRDRNYEKIRKAYENLVYGTGERYRL